MLCDSRIRLQLLREKYHQVHVPAEFYTSSIDPGIVRFVSLAELLTPC